MQSSVDAVVNEFYNPNVRVTEKFPSIFHIGCGEDVTSGGRYGYATTEHVSQATSPFYAGAKFTGHKTYLPEVYIPYSLSTVMKMAISIYSIANADNGDTPRHYAGCAGYDKDLNFINVDGIGTYQYNLMANASIPVGTRLERDVTLKGWATSGSNTSMMDAGTVYIRPMILGNYQKAGAVSVLEGYTIMPAGTVADGDSNAGTNF
jgi:hypothetical protein